MALIFANQGLTREDEARITIAIGLDSNGPMYNFVSEPGSLIRSPGHLEGLDLPGAVLNSFDLS